MLHHIILLIDIRPINEESSISNVLEDFVNWKEMLEYMEYIITFSAKEQWGYPIELFKVSLPRERQQKGKYNLKNFIITFWYTRTIKIYQTQCILKEVEHSTPKVSSFRATMNVENRDLIHKVKRTRLKEAKRQWYYRSFFEKTSIEGVFNLVRFVDKSI